MDSLLPSKLIRRVRLNGSAGLLPIDDKDELVCNIAYSVDNLSLLWDRPIDSDSSQSSDVNFAVYQEWLVRHQKTLAVVKDGGAECKEPLNMMFLCKKYLLVEFDFTRSFPMTVGVSWDRAYRGSLGCLYMERETEKGMRCRLSLSGKACASVPIELLLHFLTAVHHSDANVTCSRIDICLDDFTKKLCLENIVTALEVGNHSGFKKSNVIRNYGSRGGWTVNLGSRESEHFVRIYDKSAESRGRIDSTRWESEFKHKKSQAIFQALATAPTVADAYKLLRGYTFGNFHFLNKSDKNLERCDLLDWWLDFLMFVSHSKSEMVVDKVVTSIDSTIRWIRYQVEKSLARVARVFGKDKYSEFMDECLASGTQRLNRFDDLLAVEYMNVQFS